MSCQPPTRPALLRQAPPQVDGAGRGLGVPRHQLGLVVGLLARKAFLRPRVDLRTCLGELPPSLLTPRQFLGDRQGIDRPSGMPARSAASAFAKSSAPSAFSCASILVACS